MRRRCRLARTGMEGVGVARDGQKIEGEGAGLEDWDSKE